MDTNHATATGPLTALRQSQLAATRIRPADADEPRRSRGLHVVPDAGGDLLKSLLDRPASDPVADTARGGSRLDTQGRLTCKKLLDSLGWGAGQQLSLQQTMDAAALDDDWDEPLPDVEVTAKCELRLSRGLCHSVAIDIPGEVLPVAAPAVGGLLLTSTSYAVACLLGGRSLTPLSTPSDTAPTDPRP